MNYLIVGFILFVVYAMDVPKDITARDKFWSTEDCCLACHCPDRTTYYKFKGSLK